MSKKYLTFDEQLKKIKEKKNFKINILKSEAIQHLKNENYTRFFTPYKELFVKISFDKFRHQILEGQNKKVLQEYKDDLRVPIENKNDNFEIRDLIIKLKDTEQHIHIYPIANKFSYLIKLKKIDDTISTFLFNRIKKIELAIKTALSYFIGEQSEKEKLNWTCWIIKIAREEEKKDFLKFLKFPRKVKINDLPVWHAINGMELSKIKLIITAIIFSNLSDNKKKNFYTLLFKNGLNKKIRLNQIDPHEIINKIIIFTRLRNSVMHFERINSFLLKERTEYLKQKIQSQKKGENGDLRFWFVKNQNTDLSLGTFIKEYKYADDLEKAKISNLNLNKLQIGFYIEIENVKNGNINCVEMEILKIINWWLL